MFINLKIITRKEKSLKQLREFAISRYIAPKMRGKIWSRVKIIYQSKKLILVVNRKSIENH